MSANALSAPRRICVVTGSRAEYGVLQWLMREIDDDPALTLQLLVTGMHLMPEFGSTWRVIEADGFRIDRSVEMMSAADTPAGMARSVGAGVLGCADAFEALQPDIVVVLGDRIEILAAAQAAFIAGFPVAHISGGELTEGAIDDSIRHAITKFSRYHFVAAEPYRARVIQLGEEPERVFNVGDPGLDGIARMPLLDRAVLCAQTGLSPERPFFLVTYHPETLGGGQSPEAAMRELLAALDTQPKHQLLLTKPNADAGGRALCAMVDAHAAAQPGRVFAHTSLGQQRFLSAMKHCDAVVGNSSAGIIEAPAIPAATVNVGNRQGGRLKARSVIDCAAQRDAIAAALAHALSSAFREALPRTVSLYGQRDASTQMRDLLKALPAQRHLAKHFHDIGGNP